MSRCFGFDISPLCGCFLRVAIEESPPRQQLDRQLAFRYLAAISKSIEIAPLGHYSLGRPRLSQADHCVGEKF